MALGVRVPLLPCRLPGSGVDALLAYHGTLALPAMVLPQTFFLAALFARRWMSLCRPLLPRQVCKLAQLTLQ